MHYTPANIPPEAAAALAPAFVHSDVAMGALGGAQLGSRLANMWGGSANAAGGSNSQGWGTGSGYGNQDYGSFI